MWVWWCLTRFTTHTRLNDDDEDYYYYFGDGYNVDEQEAPFLLAKKFFGGARAAWNFTRLSVRNLGKTGGYLLTTYTHQKTICQSCSNY